MPYIFRVSAIGIPLWMRSGEGSELALKVYIESVELTPLGGDADAALAVEVAIAAGAAAAHGAVSERAGLIDRAAQALFRTDAAVMAAQKQAHSRAEPPARVERELPLLPLDDLAHTRVLFAGALINITAGDTRAQHVTRVELATQRRPGVKAVGLAAGGEGLVVAQGGIAQQQPRLQRRVGVAVGADADVFYCRLHLSKPVAQACLVAAEV